MSSQQSRHALAALMRFAANHAPRLRYRELTRARFLSAFLVFALVPPSVLNAGETSGSTQSGGSVTKAESYEVVLERVRTERLLELDDPRFPPPLIYGERHGGVIVFTTALPDPMDPNTIETNFANWNLAARASLLLSYARLVTESDKPQPYVGLSEEKRRSRVAYDAEEKARIRQVVQSGGYTDLWKPFAVSYRKLAETAEKLVPPGDTPYTDTDTLDRVARLAREQGLFRLVRELPIDPADVANEILRALHDSRRRLGAANGGTNDGANLLYACGGNPVAVHVHTWHSLAPAFFRAAEAAAGKTTDPQALLIMRVVEGLTREIGAWTAKHPNATTLARDVQLNELATKRGLYSLLKNKEQL